ncbi:hypothetical protein P5673_023802 [Acropora cervicornis]|uniref:Uncharacterized protein n=1 Tax=Acropora cervicornis TaxID=6130 RepID=A0AAD9Q4F6_ACRCE|nr:hypothetical protein P5673_023802 [Acropora cervicornis]
MNSAECRGKRFIFPSNILSKVVEISHLDNLAPHNDNLAAETVMGEIMRLLLKDTSFQRELKDTQFSKGTFPYGKQADVGSWWIEINEQIKIKWTKD